MILKLERNGRMWEGNSGPEEVLDVFYGKDYKKRVSRGFCHAAFKEIIKEELNMGGVLFIRLDIENGKNKRGLNVPLAGSLIKDLAEKGADIDALPQNISE